jgi:CBS domain-containing protein
MKVSEAMSKKLVTLSPESTVLQAVKTMISKNVSSIIITDGDEPKGLITMKDILARVIAKKKNPETIKLKDAMSTPLISINHNIDLVEGTRLAVKNRIRRLAVVNDDGKLVGIITSDDVARDLQRAAEELALTYYLMSKRAGTPG